MRPLIPYLPLLCLMSCISVSGKLESKIDPGHMVVVGVEGQQVIVQNLGTGPLEVRRRAPTGEVVGVSTLPAGGRLRMTASSRRAVELRNTGRVPVPFKVDAVAGPDGRARALILSRRQL